MFFKISPDNISVTSKMSLLEKLIMYRYFGRKQGLPELVHWMHNQVRSGQAKCSSNYITIHTLRMYIHMYVCMYYHEEKCNSNCTNTPIEVTARGKFSL